MIYNYTENVNVTLINIQIYSVRKTNNKIKWNKTLDYSIVVSWHTHCLLKIIANL
jgi:hypothetical protein